MCYVPRSLCPTKVFILQYCLHRYEDNGKMRQIIVFKGPANIWVPEWVTHWMPLPSGPNDDHIGDPNKMVDA